MQVDFPGQHFQTCVEQIVLVECCWWWWTVFYSRSMVTFKVHVLRFPPTKSQIYLVVHEEMLRGNHGSLHCPFWGDQTMQTHGWFGGILPLKSAKFGLVILNNMTPGNDFHMFGVSFVFPIIPTKMVFSVFWMAYTMKNSATSWWFCSVTSLLREDKGLVT